MILKTSPSVWGTLNDGEYYENFADVWIVEVEDKFQIFARIYQCDGGDLNYVWGAPTLKQAKRMIKRLFKVFHIIEYEWESIQDEIEAAAYDRLAEARRSTAASRKAIARRRQRDVLMSLSRCVREGDEVVIVDGSKTVTPIQAAERLGMSRTHLYKLLDRGEISFHRVGRDRRIRVHDLIQFEEQRQRDRRELAERFAHQHQTAVAATDEIADLL